jgi:hypothetical protein
MSGSTDNNYVAALQIVKRRETLDVGISADGLEEHPGAFPAMQSAAFLDTAGADNVVTFGDFHLAGDTRTWRQWDRDHERS